MILYLDTKKLCKFLSDKNPDEYYYVLISDNVLSDGKFDNVSSMPLLTPPPKVIRHFYNNGLTDEYQASYLAYLGSNIEASMNIATIVKAALVDDYKLILVNSPSEKTSCYMRLLADYIETSFMIKVYSYKDYKKNRVEAERPYTKEEKEVSMKRLLSLCKHIEDEGQNAEIIMHPELYVKNLKKLKKKELRKYCNLKNIALYGDEPKDKDAMISKIMKRISIY